MIIVKYFITALVISALGTIPIGLITLTIAQKTIEKGKSAGWLVALGASIMEFTYTFVALCSLDFLSLENEWKRYAQMITIVIFLLLGVFYLRKPAPPPISTSEVNTNQRLDFILGIGIGTMNFLILPFWLVVGLWLEGQGFNFENKACILWFSIGATIGALLIFIAYIEGSHFILKKSDKITAYANKVIGGLFLSLALFQLIQLF